MTAVRTGKYSHPSGKVKASLHRSDRRLCTPANMRIAPRPAKCEVFVEFVT